ncbi:MAG: hypothetical protein M3N04_01985 [Actinomycetota bacterium]|nr:hypothetical protein [Actinomycetota bacterium]
MFVAVGALMPVGDDSTTLDRSAVERSVPMQALLALAVLAHPAAIASRWSMTRGIGADRPRSAWLHPVGVEHERVAGQLEGGFEAGGVMGARRSR